MVRISGNIRGYRDSVASTANGLLQTASTLAYQQHESPDNTRPGKQDGNYHSL
jgi:hypothetical protein